MIHDGRTGLMVSRPVSCFAVARRGWRNKGRPAWLAVGETDHTIRLREDLLVIDVSSELTEAVRASTQASRRVLEAAKSANREQHRGAMKEWLAAEQRRRAAWLAVATPLSVGDEKNK